MTVLARPLCALFGGHTYDRHGDHLVCSYCGHRVLVKEVGS